MPKAANIQREMGGEFVFSEKKKLLARFIAEGKEIRTAAKLAGYSVNGGTVWETTKDPAFVALVKKLQSKNERMADMSRKRVLDGFLEAIEQAKMLAEPMTQIAGWRELAKMCGYYAPEVKTVNVNVSSQRLLTQLETLSDKDLLELIEQDAEVIEGEARELLEHVPNRISDSSAPA
jgi:hypothetical protein